MWGGVPGFNEEETPLKKSQAIRKELCYFCVGRGYIVLGAADLQTGRYIRWGCCFKNRYDSRGPSGLSSHSASAAYCPLAVACCCCCSLFRVGLTDYDDCASSLFLFLVRFAWKGCPRGHAPPARCFWVVEGRVFSLDYNFP